MNALRRPRVGWFLVVLFGVLLLFSAASAEAQPPFGSPPPACRDLWSEANTLAARDALQAAGLAAGQPPSQAAGAWSQAWTRAWTAAWTAAGVGLTGAPGAGCCNNNWFGLGVQSGKRAWDSAGQTAPMVSGADKAWADRFAAQYAEEWAKEWFLHYPWLCARARANATANAFATAFAFADATADSWAFAWANTDAWAEVQTAVWTDVWTNAGAAAWASAGATAMTGAAAAATASAVAAVSGNCALAAANACAAAAAEAFAQAWAEAGAAAYSSAYASAAAQAGARALARAWASAIASANARAFAVAFAAAYSSAGARAFAAVWRQRLANEGQLPAIVRWWTTPGAPMPAVATLWRMLAGASANANKAAFKAAFDVAWAQSASFQADFARARSQAQAELFEYTSSWVSTWSEAWAAKWVESWSRAYARLCARAAAVACAQCPTCTTTTGTGTRPRTVSQPRGFTWTLVGLGVTAGNIFEIIVRNQTGEPISVEVPGGTVFKPSNPDYQRMITDNPQRVDLAPNQTAQAPLNGYCLDYGKQPPPATTLGRVEADPILVAAAGSLAALGLAVPPRAQAAQSLSYQVDDNPAEYGVYPRIIQAGNQLAVEGKFHKDLPPQKYKLAVIQRAIWTYSMRASATPHSRETLLGDIRQQVKASGGTQSNAQIEELVNHILEDVQAVLRAAGAN